MKLLGFLLLVLAVFYAGRTLFSRRSSVRSSEAPAQTPEPVLRTASNPIEPPKRESLVSAASKSENRPDPAEQNKRFGLHERDDLGEPAKALPFFERALEADPNRLDIGEELRKTFTAAEEQEEGLKYFRKLVREHPENPHVQLQMGAYALENGDAQLAIEHLKTAKSQMGDLLQTYDLLSEAYLTSSKPQEAYRVLRELLQFHLDRKKEVADLGFSTAGIDSDIERTEAKIHEIENESKN